MKKSMKKHLILALVVIAIAVTAVFAVSAAPNVGLNCPTHGANAQYYIVTQIETCEHDRTYTYKCNVCNAVLATETVPGTMKKHDYERKYILVDNEYYKAVDDCKTCVHKINELEGKYHKVTFINQFATDNVTNYGYVKLANSYKDLELAVKYVKEGTSVTNISAQRAADVNYGKYELIGWSDTPNSETADYDTTIEIAEDDKVADHTVYAVFKPVDVKYIISFYDDNGRLISGTLPSIRVAHGTAINFDSVEYKKYKELEKADDMTYRYKFSHWVVQDHSDVTVGSTTPIYGEMNLKAVFNSIAKEYKFAYYLSYKDKEHNVPVMINGSAVTDIVSPAVDKGPKNGLEMNKSATGLEALYGYSDLVNDYKFTGKWIVVNGQAAGRELDLSNLDLSKMLDTVATTEPIILIPKYKAIQKLYPIEIKAGYIDDMDATEHPTEATLQITDASGNLVLTQKLTRKPEDANYKYVAKVPYTDEYYKIAVVSGAYAGSETSTYIAARDQFSYVEFDMERKGKDDCNCFCHSLIKPIWLKVLNLIYSLFGKKIVCCDDLFAENGHLLNYTAND